MTRDEAFDILARQPPEVMDAVCHLIETAVKMPTPEESIKSANYSVEVIRGREVRR